MTPPALVQKTYQKQEKWHKQGNDKPLAFTKTNIKGEGVVVRVEFIILASEPPHIFQFHHSVSILLGLQNSSNFQMCCYHMTLSL